MSTSPIVLVPGFWLGAWAWDEVAAILRAKGYDVTAITLPGLESVDADRASVSLADHVRAIVDAVSAKDVPCVLVVHSASGYSGYAAADVAPERIAAMVYVDTAPGKGAVDPSFADDERPMVWDEIKAEENLDGLTEAQLATFRERAVPVPGVFSARRTHSRTMPGTTSRPRSSRPATPRRAIARTRRDTPKRRSSPACSNCATSRTSICRRATGRCGRSRRSSRRSSPASPTPTRPGTSPARGQVVRRAQRSMAGRPLAPRSCEISPLWNASWLSSRMRIDRRVWIERTSR